MSDLNANDIHELELQLIEMKRKVEEGKKQRIKSLNKKTQEIIKIQELISEVAKSFFVDESYIYGLICVKTTEKDLPVYQHPTIKELTWSGKGKRKSWVNEWLANGGTLEQIRVEG
jgi:hypothetical protein